jgi:site-specific DNA-cytosine methylase
MGQGGNNTPMVLEDRRAYTLQSFGQYAESGVASNLQSRDYKSATDLVIEKHQRKYIVRRLTPTECARLQGFPDWWCDGAEGSDSAQYKLWGNGIALPCAVDVIRRIVKAAGGEQNEQIP